MRKLLVFKGTRVNVILREIHMIGKTRRTVGWISSGPLRMKSNQADTTATLSAAYENRFQTTVRDCDLRS